MVIQLQVYRSSHLCPGIPGWGFRTPLMFVLFQAGFEEWIQPKTTARSSFLSVSQTRFVRPLDSHSSSSLTVDNHFLFHDTLVITRTPGPLRRMCAVASRQPSFVSASYAWLQRTSLHPGVIADIQLLSLLRTWTSRPIRRAMLPWQSQGLVGLHNHAKSC